MTESDSAPRISVSLSLSGADLEPRDFSSLTGLESTDESSESKVMGKLADTGEPNIRQPYWRFKLKKIPSYSLSEAFAQLVSILWPHRDAIVQYLEQKKDRDIRAAFLASITIREDRPLYDLQPEILRRLAYFGIELSLDIFDYSD